MRPPSATDFSPRVLRTRVRAVPGSRRAAGVQFPVLPPRPRPARGLRRAVLRALVPALVLLAGASESRAQDPFAPGLRWTRAATNADAWIPRSVAFADGGEFVWCSATGTRAHLELDAANGAGAVLPLERDDTVVGAISVLSVAAGRDPGALFSVAQYPQPDAAHRATRVGRYDPALGGAFAPVWTVDSGLVVNGPARLACDEAGARVFVALWNDTAHTVQLDALDGVSGALIARTTIPATNLSELCVSADGARVALSAGLELFVFDAQLATEHHELLAVSTRALAFDAHGDLLAVGATGSLRVLERAAAGYTTVRTVLSGRGEIATRVELSRDGGLAAIGWWNSLNGVDVRLEAFDVKHGVRLWENVQLGTAGGLQNLPEALRISPDGRRIALGTWGGAAGVPELQLFERASGAVVLAADLPGSVQTLALDETGTRIAVGFKNTHANVFATTGQFRLYDTGERDLTVTDTPRVGGTLELSARAANATEVLFLFGVRAPAPLYLAGSQGELWLKRTRLITVPVAADGNGRADLSRAIPADPQLVGRRWHVQAAFRIQGVLHFSRTVLDPVLF